MTKRADGALTVLVDYWAQDRVGIASPVFQWAVSSVFPVKIASV